MLSLCYIQKIAKGCDKMSGKNKQKLEREKQIIWRLTPEEKELLEIMAKENKTSVSAYMRQVIFLNNEDVKKAKKRIENTKHLILT